MLNKVPEIFLIFWIIKIMATTVWETAADFLNTTLNFWLNYTSLTMSVFFAIALMFQLRAKKYIPALYWLVVVLVSVVGTLLSDNLVDNLWVTLEISSGIFALWLLIVFVTWYMSEKTLSVHTIVTRKRELFYWAAILFTFALGTSAWDMIGEKLWLWYTYSAIMFWGIIALMFGGFRFWKLNSVFAFWAAYIITRPLWASLWDLLTQAPEDGGLGIGTNVISFIFFAMIIVGVVYLSIEERKKLQIT